MPSMPPETAAPVWIAVLPSTVEVKIPSPAVPVTLEVVRISWPPSRRRPDAASAITALTALSVPTKDATNGVAYVHLRAAGRASHAGAAPEKGRNAAVELARRRRDDSQCGRRPMATGQQSRNPGGSH